MAKTPKFKIEAENIVRAMPIITTVLAIGLLFAAYVLLFMPKLGRLVPNGQYDLTPYQTAVNDEQAYQATLRSQTANYEMLNPVQREKALNLVTTEPDFPGLLVQISSICEQHQVVCPSIDVMPDQVVLVGNRKSVRMSLNIVGADYAGMKSFLLDLERSRRIFDVESVIFSPGSQSFSISFKAYFLASVPVPTKSAVPVSAAAMNAS